LPSLATTFGEVEIDFFVEDSVDDFGIVHSKKMLNAKC
jgi:hypothetical protein